VAQAIAQLGGLRYVDRVLTPAEARQLRSQGGDEWPEQAACDEAA